MNLVMLLQLVTALLGTVSQILTQSGTRDLGATQPLAALPPEAKATLRALVAELDAAEAPAETPPEGTS